MRGNKLLLGEPIKTFDLGEALKLQNGHFKVIPEDGKPFYVTCETGRGIVDVVWPNQSNTKPLIVEKIYEPAYGGVSGEIEGPTAMPARSTGT
jgi:hypothetical protein